MLIKPGEQYDSYDNQQIVIVGQKETDKVSFISAKKNGAVDLYATQLLQNISSPNVNITAKMNANYFVNDPKSSQYGMALGVRCGLDEWEVPRQYAWYFYGLYPDGQTKCGMDTSFWSSKNECVFACSPAMILLKDGQPVNYVSPGAGSSKSNPTSQSMLLRIGNRFAFAVCRGKLSPEQCRQWALTIDGIQDLCLMDSGGSSCLEYDHRLLVSTTRKISNALCFYNAETGGDSVLKGIDISHWQNGIDLNAVDFDFAIMKATEGIGYVDPSCDKFYWTVKNKGKLLGFYHFARPSNDAIREAQFFYENTKNYFGEAIPVLDWEAENKNDTEWALKWLDEVYRLSGVKPMIYMSESVVNAYDWSKVVAGNYGLWVAKYRDKIADYNYDMSLAGNAPSVKWWNGYAMWQWTSVGQLDGYKGSLDCDVFYGDTEAWKAYASKQEAVEPADDDLTVRISELQKQIEEHETLISALQKRIETAVKALKGEV